MWHIVRYSWHYNGVQLHMMCGMRGERDMRHMCGVSCGKRDIPADFRKEAAHDTVLGPRSAHV